MRNRIVCWILCLAIALGLFFHQEVKNFVDEKFLVEKASIYVYAHEDMEEGFKTALKMSGMRSTHKIVMTDDETKANIIVNTQKEYDPEYEKIAFSPFVVAYNTETNYANKMKKAGLLVNSKYDETQNDSYLEIDFLQVVNEVIGNGSWEKFGLKNKGNIEVFYPDKSTPYWSDFYDFMLVTVNNGKYPETVEEMQKAIEKIEKFENSKYTEAVGDFEAKLQRTEDFTANCLWVIPEKLVSELVYPKSARLFYPTVTVHLNYYIKCDELGNKIKACFSEEGLLDVSFYTELSYEEFRSSEHSKLESISDYISYEKDSYNYIELDYNRIRPEDVIPSN